MPSWIKNVILTFDLESKTMTLMVDLPPDLEARLRLEAHGKAMALGDLIASLLEAEESEEAPYTHADVALPFFVHATSEDWERKLRRWVSAHPVPG